MAGGVANVHVSKDADTKRGAFGPKKQQVKRSPSSGWKKSSSK